MIYLNTVEPNKKIDIVIAGAGATGSYLTNFVARNLNALNIKNVGIIVVDFDKVEMKNLMNQNFIQSDTGKYKAEVIARRYSKIYPHIYFIIDRIEKAIYNIDSERLLVVLCVDNFESRLETFDKLLVDPHVIGIIDIGVHPEGGQTLFFPLCDFVHSFIFQKNKEKQIFGGFHSTDVIPWHIKMAKPNPAKISCGNGIPPIWNITGAALATSFIMKILTRKTIKYLGIFFGETYRFYDCEEFYNIMQFVKNGGKNDQRNSMP
jgi:hypothetical protein